MTAYVNHDINKLLAKNSYPGRGIISGISPDGDFIVCAYFIMGRSENSRNRIFRETDDGIKTEAFDPTKLSDPSLIIYHPVRFFGEQIIITNGDQTDTIWQFLKGGSTFERALETRKFEPDAPNFTPRISSIVCADGSYTMAVLKSADAIGSACARNFFSFPALSGVGHFLHTYDGDGLPLPSFRGELIRIETSNDMDNFASGIWSNLNDDNKVSLYICYKNRKTGEIRSKIINKNTQGAF